MRPHPKRPFNAAGYPKLTCFRCIFTFADAVRSPSAAITMAAKDWVDRCRANKDAATAELLTFLLQACGVTDRALTEEEVAGTSVDELRAEADEIAKEVRPNCQVFC